MIELPFCTTGTAPTVSPLAHALEGATGIRDVSARGKLEVRGTDVRALQADAEVIPLTARRALVLCDADTRAALARSLPGVVVDITAAYAGIEVDGEPLLRRLTDLDLAALPAAGKVAGVPAYLTRDGARFTLWFAQEVGESVVEIVRDAQAGLA